MRTLPVHPWPAAQAPSWDGELLALSVITPGARDDARLAVRAAICEVASLLLDIGEERLEVAGAPGSAPRLLVDGSESGVGISISHETGIAVAVLHRNGAVGVDLMRIALASDWARVAHEYLGMAVATGLAAIDEQARPLAFCQAWTRREATLKCLGEPLREFRHGEAGNADCSTLTLTLALALEDGLAGSVAIKR